MNYIEHYSATLKPERAFSKNDLIREVGESSVDLQEALATVFLIENSASNGGDSGFELASGPTCRAAEVVYDYAVSGIWPDPSRAGVFHTDELFLDFSLRNEWTRSAVEHFGGTPPLAAEKALAMAYLRARLDHATLGRSPEAVILESDTDSFSLFEIAVLAQMAEKSVRNATQQRANDRLKTTPVGTRALVEAGEALRWLKGRRSFTSTVLPTSE